MKYTPTKGTLSVEEQTHIFCPMQGANMVYISFYCFSLI